MKRLFFALSLVAVLGLGLGATSAAPLATDTIPPNSIITTAGVYPPELCPTAITGIAYDNPGGSGVNRVEIRIRRTSDRQYWNGTTWHYSPVWLVATGTTSWSYPFTPSPGETYIVWSLAWDNAGNREYYYDANWFQCTGIVDTTPPDSTVTTSGTYPAGACPSVITGTASDDLSGVNRVEITIQRDSDGKYWDGATWVGSAVWLLATGTTNWLYAFTPAVGESYTVQSRATDNAGNVETSYGTSSFGCGIVPPPPPPPPCEAPLYLRVQGSYDDAHDLGSFRYHFYPTTQLISLGRVSTRASTAGLRFSGVNIPQGATITSAVLRVKAGADFVNTLRLKISADDVDDSEAFTHSHNRPSSRARTDAQVDWDPGAWWGGEWYDSPDLAAVIQEVVNRPGWASGNALSLILSDDGSPMYEGRTIYARDYSAADAAQLILTCMASIPR